MVTLCAKLRQRLRRVFVDKGRTGEDCCRSVGGSENLLLFQGVLLGHNSRMPALVKKGTNESLNPPGLDFLSLVEFLKKKSYENITYFYNPFQLRP